MSKRVRKSTRSAQEKPDHLGLERLIFFSDAVFAIAITLLALDIRLPAGEGSLDDAQLTHALLAIGPKYMAFFISFLVIGSLWTGHHRKFRYIERYDNRLLLINLLFLMSIAFMPFPTSVLSEYGNRTATIFYALAMITPFVLSLVLWVYASHHNRLIHAEVNAHIRRRETLRPLAMAGVFAISIGVAYIDSDLAKLSWGLGFIVVLFFR